VAWGLNDYGQCDVPALPPGLTYVEIAAGDDYFQISGYTLARRSDGSAVAWGYFNSVPPLPPGLSYVKVAAGAWHFLALRSDGKVVAQGDCSYGQCSVPPLPRGLTYVQIAAGEFHSVAIRSDGSVVAWGDNEFGACNVPVLPEGLTYLEVAAGDSYTVARYGGCPTCELPFCLGDGGPRSVSCPCANNGAREHGCDNSASTGGAHLTVNGSVDPDRVVLTAANETPSSLSLFLQGSSVVEAGAPFGEGSLCIGGRLSKIAVKRATAGAATYPDSRDPSIGSRSAALGDPIAPGTYRYYQVCYRDPTGLCSGSAPPTLNTSNAVMVAW